MLSRIDLYVLRKTLVPFLATMVVAAALLLLERMLRLFDFVVNENGPVDVVWQMLAHLVPHYMSLALPIGLFLGVMLALRGLSLSSELDAMNAGGVGLPRLLRPLLALALLLALVDLLLVGFLQPYSRYAYRNLEFELRSGAFGASVRVGDFVQLAENVTFRAGGSRNAGRELTDIFVRREAAGGDEISITAKRGAFFATQDDQTVLLRLYDGRLIDFDVKQKKPRVLSFAAQDVVLDLPQIEEFRGRGGGELELTLPELFEALRAGTIAGDLEDDAWANLHWRIVHILTILVLPVMAAPLGISDKRSGAATGLVVGLALLIVYNELLEAGERQVAIGNLPPWLSLWPLFFGFLALGLYFFSAASYRPGRGVLLLLDRVADAMLLPLRRALSAARRIR